ncbi:hypothetical protein [Alicyclobacillus kakegawensis]|uniref:hypothetical protein n=1 Tax=Alicyclobacillus kakegawensis TaxID=392012 RepID=UPI0034E21DB0
MLIHIDWNRHTYDALSIQRDTRMYMPGNGYTEITSSGMACLEPTTAVSNSTRPHWSVLARRCWNILLYT